MPYANNKGADQLAHQHILISAFVVRYLDSIYTSTCKSRNLKTLASLHTCAGWFESYLVEHPEDRFSCGEALNIFIWGGQSSGIMVAYGVLQLYYHSTVKLSNPNVNFVDSFLLSLIIFTAAGVKCMCGGTKKSSRTSS